MLDPALVSDLFAKVPVADEGGNAHGTELGGEPLERTLTNGDEPASLGTYPAELAALVVRGYRDRLLWERLSRGGRARIAASFSPERVRQDLIEGVLASPALERARARPTGWLERTRAVLGC